MSLRGLRVVHHAVPGHHVVQFLDLGLEFVPLLHTFATRSLTVTATHRLRLQFTRNARGGHASQLA